ncbi:Uma2 family endonuclease [Gemmata sp. G18]|uniref:Uma2 family endonuclease n=1 Tax=Gemmata palustris TaxID=2822762 RepID=A0ABS5BSF1_9BACT|nr:Uma2 family endonuclease [Gemmata palustris]MBP3956656.1 Uma2 family endonuclease [Gemmata palustris]
MSTVATPAAPRRLKPHRWTVPEFHRLCRLGLFTGRRPILLDGVILEQGPMDAPHANGVERTDTAVRLAFGTGWRFRIQLPLVLNLHTDPVPDVAIIAGVLTGNLDHPTTAALVIEVSDTTFDTDTTEKAELYATAGIRDYWVLDVANRQLHVFRAPQPLPTKLSATVYRAHTVLGPNDTISPLAAPNATIRVADLLP